MNLHENASIGDDELAALYDQTSTVTGLLNSKRFINEEFIAEGAIKAVYKVTDTHCEREVALARIKSEAHDWLNSLEFIREVQLTSGFEHPHIIRVYDIGIADDSPWFTMELTSGKTLEDWGDPEKHTLNRKFNAISNICEAIQYAHERGTFHLDLKPSNVSIGVHGQVLVVDWGIASSIAKLSPDKSIDGDTIHNLIKGTPGFMAPEQTQEEYKPSALTDIFGIGAIFFYLLTGESPVVGETPEERLENTKKLRLKSFDHPNIPPRIVPILTKSLSPDPLERYASAQDLDDDLGLYRNGFATEAESASLGTLLRLFVTRHKKRCIFGLMLLIMAMCANYFYIQKIQESEKNAEDEKHKALQLLREIEERDEKLRSQYIEYANAQFHRARGLRYRGYLRQAYELSEVANKLDPGNPQFREQLGILSFATHRFEQAAELLAMEELRPRYRVLLELSNQLASLPEEERIDHFPVVFRELCRRFRSPFASYFFIYHSNTESRVGHEKLVKILIEHDNRLKNMYFDWNPTSRVLDLSSNPKLKTLTVTQTTYCPKYKMLQGLPVETLILDDTAHNRKHAKSYRPNKACLVKFVK